MAGNCADHFDPLGPDHSRTIRLVTLFDGRIQESKQFTSLNARAGGELARGGVLPVDDLLVIAFSVILEQDRCHSSVSVPPKY